MAEASPFRCFDPRCGGTLSHAERDAAQGQVLHGSATTTEAVRHAIQAREESERALARRYGISPTTVQK